MNKILHWLWGLSEIADWYSWPPRRFWSWLLGRLNRRNGYTLKYDN